MYLGLAYDIELDVCSLTAGQIHGSWSRLFLHDRSAERYIESLRSMRVLTYRHNAAPATTGFDRGYTDYCEDPTLLGLYRLLTGLYSALNGDLLRQHRSLLLFLGTGLWFGMRRCSTFYSPWEASYSRLRVGSAPLRGRLLYRALGWWHPLHAVSAQKELTDPPSPVHLLLRHYAGLDSDRLLPLSLH